MGKTIRRFNRSEVGKEPKKKEKYKLKDQYKGLSSEDVYEDEDEDWYGHEPID